MVDGGYRPHFGAVDSMMKQDFPDGDFEFLWVEYYDKVKPELQEKAKKKPNFKIITLNKSGIYHSSECFNKGIKSAIGEVIVIPDGDVVFDKNFLREIWNEHKRNENLVMYLYRYDEPQHAHTSMNIDLDYLSRICILTNPSNYGGCLTVRKKWLLKINGYEEYEIFRTGGDHANGLDIYTRFKNLGLHIMWHPDLKIYHPWHEHKAGVANAYKPQHVFIQYRASQREVSAFKGLDSKRNREVPGELISKIAKTIDSLNEKS